MCMGHPQYHFRRVLADLTAKHLTPRCFEAAHKLLFWGGQVKAVLRELIHQLARRDLCSLLKKLLNSSNGMRHSYNTDMLLSRRLCTRQLRSTVARYEHGTGW